MLKNKFFTVTHIEKNSKARVGCIRTNHGIIETPAFIFCGTKANVKNVSPNQLNKANTQIILSNTYHLLIQPGSNIIAEHKGLQNYTQWKKPMMTDSGGYQIFSLGHGSVSQEIKGKMNLIKNKSLLKIREEGAYFKSYLNGDKIFLSPEISIKTQRELGADLIFVLDECTPYNVDKIYTEKSMLMSNRWAERCVIEFNKRYLNYSPKCGSSGFQSLYGIIQGGVYEDLRKSSCNYISDQEFDGLAIGGSLGAEKKQMYDIFELCSTEMDKSKPVHVLGVGDLDDIIEGVDQGYDTFDCVSPTRKGRHGVILSRENPKGINLNNSRYKNDTTVLNEDCNLSEAQFSKSYIHHLLKSNEILASSILSTYNVWFMNKFMSDLRESIRKEKFLDFKKDFYNNLIK